jgi:hypothetical protein
MTTQPVDDRYPESWRPAWAPAFSEPEPESKPEPLAMELHAAAMTDSEWAEFTKRIGRS